MPEHEVASREEWLAASKELLEREKELTRRSDEVTKQRMELPWVRIEKEYEFATDEGTKTLAELFDGRSQLLMYHFMFGPEYEAGCPVCSSGADMYNGAVPHLNARDVTFLCASRGPLEKLQAYKRRMGWSFPWVSTAGSDFNFDFNVSFTKEQQREGSVYNFREMGDITPLIESPPGPIAQNAAACGTDAAGYMSEAPGLSAFKVSDGDVYHTYSCYARGLEFLLGYYPMLDRVPLGRDEAKDTEFWVRRHDEY
jgi:predicted dithiol-disulfide oxidoreductase (DUF899 family)